MLSHSARQVLHRRTGFVQRFSTVPSPGAVGTGARGCCVVLPPVGASSAPCRGARTYSCARCEAEVLVCSGCDRGQRYCSVGCREQSRRECLRAAGQRYQSTRAGRFAHARRARGYRQRQKIVTHQASQTAPAQTTVAADPVETEVAQAAAAVVVTTPWHCRWCGGVCMPMVRRGFLRHGRVPCNVAPQGRRGPVYGRSP